MLPCPHQLEVVTLNGCTNWSHYLVTHNRDASKDEAEEVSKFLADDNAQQMMAHSVPLDHVTSTHSYA